MCLVNLALAVLVVSASLFAQQSQNELPSAPIPVQSLSLMAHAGLSPTPAAAELAARIFPKDRKVISKSFIAWTLADGATIAADAYTTVHCLSLPNCIEKNPLFGSHPSTQRVVVTESAFFATDTLVSYWLKKKGKSWWWVPALANTAQGGIAAGLNLRHR